MTKFFVSFFFFVTPFFPRCFSVSTVDVGVSNRSLEPLSSVYVPFQCFFDISFRFGGKISTNLPKSLQKGVTFTLHQGRKRTIK